MEEVPEKAPCTRPPPSTALHTPCEHVPDAPVPFQPMTASQMTAGQSNPQTSSQKTAGQPQRLYIIFTDLDHTVTPLNTRGIDRFALLIRAIQTKGKCAVRFVPISGRSSDYVRCFCHTLRHTFAGVGSDLDDVIDLASGEQGATVIDCSKSYHVECLVDACETDFKARVARLLGTLPPALKAIIRDEPAKLYTCSLHILVEAKAGMSLQQVESAFETVEAHIRAGLGLDETGAPAAVFVMSHKTLEVMPRSVSKSRALRHMLCHYSSLPGFDVVAISYSGDAPNDRECIDYISRLTEVPGMHAHVFLPSNADASISAAALEGCKGCQAGPHERVLQAPPGRAPYWEGVMELIETALDNGTLLGQGKGQGQGVGQGQGKGKGQGQERAGGKEPLGCDFECREGAGQQS